MGPTRLPSWEPPRCGRGQARAIGPTGTRASRKVSGASPAESEGSKEPKPRRPKSLAGPAYRGRESNPHVLADSGF